MSAGSNSPMAAVRACAMRLTGGAHDYDALLEMAADRHFVLIGEASHGTREFYRMRAEITRRLIEEQGFEAVAVEGDWPDVYALNRHARGDATTADQAFAAFERFPRWMWCNEEVAAFIRWLREHNATQAGPGQAGFYGLDLYSLYRSVDAVIAYLDAHAPEQAQAARQRYACLDHVRDPQQYGFEAALRRRPDCREAVARQLAELRHAGGPPFAEPETLLECDERFHAERNAVVVRHAEAYYRAMFGSRVNTWNLRDEHMADTLFALHRHLREQGRQGRVVVWAHNSHVGDARATDMGRAGEHTLGQLVRERVGQAQCLLVGMTTYTGFVSAAHDWDADVERMAVRPALEGSVERLFERSGLERFFLPLDGTAAQPLRAPMLERAIGVIYRPQTERASHYFNASLSAQFDAVFHVDETEAVEPLYAASGRRRPPEDEHDAPETYPFGV